MPHPRALEKQEREKQLKQESRQALERAKEDAKWVDDHKSLRQKEERQAAKEAKLVAADQKEREKRELLAKEEAELANYGKTKNQLHNKKSTDLTSKSLLFNISP